MRKFLSLLFIAGSMVVALQAAVFTTAAFPAHAFVGSDSVNVNQVVNNETTLPPNNNSSGSQTNSLQISNVSIFVNANFARVEWKTNINSISKVNWGLNPDYKEGVLLAQQFLKTHSIVIPNLKEKTNYYFSITATDSSGKERVYTGQFFTLTGLDLTPPANVSKFTATPKQTSISLTWKNPIDGDFSLVRVVRSTKFFPTDPTNGQVVYEGSGEFVEDTNVTPGTIYYYAVYGRDYAGNYSSGALDNAFILWFSETGKSVPDNNKPVVDLGFVNAPADQIPEKPLTLNEFSFFADNNPLTLYGQSLSIPNTVHLKSTLPKIQFFQEAEFMIATVKDSQNLGTKYTYSFSLNEQTGNYEVEFPKFDLAGKYTILITIFNSSKQVLQNTEFFLSVKGMQTVVNDPNTPSLGVIEELKSVNEFLLFAPSLLAAGLLSYFLLLARWRRRRKEDSEK